MTKNSKKNNDTKRKNLIGGDGVNDKDDKK